MAAKPDEESDTNEAALLSEAASRRSVTDILAEVPGHLAFQTAEEVDASVREEREAWER